MKYRVILFCCVFFASMPAWSASSYIEDVKSLGYISGEGLACGAKRYPSYELVARAYLVSKARSDEEQASGMYEYNAAKAQAYLRKKRSGLWDCDDVNARFNNQKIFNSKLYKNGTIKLPDGKIIKPRQKYDVTLLYNLNDNERERLDAYYEKSLAKQQKRAQEQGIYKKIRQKELQR